MTLTGNGVQTTVSNSKRESVEILQVLILIHAGRQTDRQAKVGNEYQMQAHREPVEDKGESATLYIHHMAQLCLERHTADFMPFEMRHGQSW